MSEIALNKENMNNPIDGVSLPSSIQLSIVKRGGGIRKATCQYNEDTKNIEVLCSNCGKWHSVYHLEDGEWVDINESYKTSKDSKTKESYFGSRCSECYSQTLSTAPVEPIAEPSQPSAPEMTSSQDAGTPTQPENPSSQEPSEMSQDDKHEDVDGTTTVVPKTPWSKHGTGKQRTLFLTESNDRYFRVQCALMDMKPNEFINHVLAEHMKTHPLHI